MLVTIPKIGSLLKLQGSCSALPYLLTLSKSRGNNLRIVDFSSPFSGRKMIIHIREPHGKSSLSLIVSTEAVPINFE